MRSFLNFTVLVAILAGAACQGAGGVTDSGPDGLRDGADGTDGTDRLPPPLLTSIDPQEGPVEGGTAVVLAGSGFDPAASVQFGAVVLGSSRVVNAGRIEGITPPGSAGAVDVRVTNPDSQFDVLPGAFTYLVPVSGDCPRETNCPLAEAAFDFRPSESKVTSVSLAADFTGWLDGAIPMTGDGQGNYTVLVKLAEGRYEYKFVVHYNDANNQDQVVWHTDPAAGSPEPFFGNSVRFHDDPCTPNLNDAKPAYGEILGAAEVALRAAYQDGAAKAGIDPASICLMVDQKAQRASYDTVGSRITADLQGLSEGDHFWWLSAADLAGHRSSEISGMFTVNVQGEPPVADAGPTQFVYAGSPVVLDATWSRDPDGIALTGYSWSQTDGTAVTLAAQYVTPREGYDAHDGSPVPQPPKTDALMGFTPPSPGGYRFQLTVTDADGTSPPAIAEVIALNPGAGTKPQARVQVSEAGGKITADASPSTAGASFRWYADVRNPAAPILPSGAILALGPLDVVVDGTYFFYVVATVAGADSLPATVQVKKAAGAVHAWNYDAPPPWLPDAEIYEVFVREFSDGNSDGIGDLKGLAAKLDYLKDLGVNTLWLMPVFESADHAHGYHTMNYLRVERDYGNNRDLLDLIQAAHARGMRVVLDLVINHTSRHHPLFLASLDPASRFRDHYIWFTDAQPTDPLLSQYGFGRELGGNRLSVQAGWGDIPDVNFGNPVARERFFRVARFWMDPNGDGDFSDGVDGFRLDHVTGPAHQVWQDLRRELKTLRPDLLLLAEVFRDFDNGGAGYGIKDYYRGEFDLAFTFPFYWAAEGIFTRGEPVGACDPPCDLDWLTGAIADRFDPGAVMCFFIENHDVPTNKTVYDSWGRVEGKLIAANTLMQTMPNSPQLLYGQELGTTVWRGPMPWALDDGQNTLKAAYRALLHLRADHQVLRRGSYVRLPVTGAPSDVFAFARVEMDETVVVVVNVRGSAAANVTVDLSLLGGSPTGIKDLITGQDWTAASGMLISRTLGAYEVWAGTVE